jgi:hypothetical protein
LQVRDLRHRKVTSSQWQRWDVNLAVQFMTSCQVRLVEKVWLAGLQRKHSGKTGMQVKV